MMQQTVTPASACAKDFIEQFTQLSAGEQLEVLGLIKEVEMKGRNEPINSYLYGEYSEELENWVPHPFVRHKYPVTTYHCEVISKTVE